VHLEFIQEPYLKQKSPKTITHKNQDSDYNAKRNKI
jgi:hypothetical protein